MIYAARERRSLNIGFRDIIYKIYLFYNYYGECYHKYRSESGRQKRQPGTDIRPPSESPDRGGAAAEKKIHI